MGLGSAAAAICGSWSGAKHVLITASPTRPSDRAGMGRRRRSSIGASVWSARGAGRRYGGERGEAVRVNRMIAAAINADPRWFWEGPDA